MGYAETPEYCRFRETSARFVVALLPDQAGFTESARAPVTAAVRPPIAAVLAERQRQMDRAFGLDTAEDRAASQQYRRTAPMAPRATLTESARQRRLDAALGVAETTETTTTPTSTQAKLDALFGL